jgi:hypothetical protein
METLPTATTVPTLSPALLRSLSHNQIGDAGATAIATALRSNTTLLEIKLVTSPPVSSSLPLSALRLAVWKATASPTLDALF